MMKKRIKRPKPGKWKYLRSGRGETNNSKRVHHKLRNKVSQVRVQHGGHGKCWAGGVVSPYLSEAMVLNVTGRAVSA